MLIQFNFKNFRSFRDDATLDLSAAKVTEMKHHVYERSNEKILPIACIMGANASGKTNVYEAFHYMTTFVRNSFAYENDEDAPLAYPEPTPFLFDAKSKDKGSSFEVYFLLNDLDNKIYNYGFTVNKEGIQEEWLHTKSKTASEYRPVLKRTKHSLKIHGAAKSYFKNIEMAMTERTLVVSLGAKLRIPPFVQIREWFMNHEFANYGDPVENLFLTQRLSSDFVERRQTQEDMIRFISTFDPSIIDFSVEKIDNEEQGIRIDAFHRMADSNEKTSIPLETESAGTLKMFSLFPVLCSAIRNGSVLFVDELNDRLHPLLLRAFLIYFTNKETNPHGAQLIFTSHEPWLISSDVLRRDEIWFTQKQADGSSSLYSLVEFKDADGDKIRKDENYTKNYLLGKYGAIPELSAYDLCMEGDK